MDGMLQFLEQPDAAGGAPHLLGILYAEDFDDPPSQQKAEDAPSKGEPAPLPITPDDVARACAAAVAAARAEWQASDNQLRTSMLASINARLKEAREAAERAALAAAEGTVATMLAVLSGALPHLCREHGASEARALVARLLPARRSEPRVTVRVHPDFVAGLQQDVADLDPDLAATVAVIAAPIERGDLKISWQNGSFTRDTAQILTAMQDALDQLGLQQRADTIPQRSAAFAE